MPSWLVWCLISLVVWGVWGIIPYEKSKEMSDEQMMVVSTIGLLVAASGLMGTKRVRTGRLTWRGAGIAMLTGTLGSSGNYFLLRAIANGGEASVVFPLTGTFPFITLLLAMAFLRERINLAQGAGVILSLAAIALFSGLKLDSLTSWTGSGGTWLAYSLLTLLLFGLTGITQKLITNEISPETGTVFFALGFIPTALGVALLDSKFNWTIPGRDWMVGIIWGVLTGVALITQLAAYRTGKASIVTAIAALYPAITVILAAAIYHEAFTVVKITAIILALVSAVLMARETPETPAPVPTAP